MSDDGWVPGPTVDAVDGNRPSITRAWGDEIAVYKVGNEYFANSNFCTHAIARLSGGSLDGHILKCPLHEALFDIRTGRCAGGMMTPDLTHYEVRVRGDVVEVSATRTSAAAESNRRRRNGSWLKGWLAFVPR